MPYARRCLPALSALAIVAGCREGTFEPRPPDIPRVAAVSVTPEVAQALGPDGRFVASRLTPEAVDGTTIADAEDLAFRHLRWHGRGIEALFSRGHGQPVRFDRLKVCRPTLYAEPSVTVSDTTDLPPSIREFVEGAFLISLCQNGDPFVAVLYAIVPSAVRYRFGNRIDIPSDGGRGLFPYAIARGTEPYPTAERAVSTLWETTQVRVAGLPKLVLPHPRFGAEFARWTAPFERPVEGVAAGARVRTTELSFGRALGGEDRPVTVLAMARDTIPSRLQHIDHYVDGTLVRRFHVQARPGHSVWYEPFLKTGER